MLKIENQSPLPVQTLDERREYQAAARLARDLFPGEIGEALAEPLLATYEFGYRLGMQSKTRRLIAALRDEQRKRNQQAARGCTCRRTS